MYAEQAVEEEAPLLRHEWVEIARAGLADWVVKVWAAAQPAVVESVLQRHTHFASMGGFVTEQHHLEKWLAFLLRDQTAGWNYRYSFFSLTFLCCTDCNSILRVCHRCRNTFKKHPSNKNADVV
jgi:hypothetical protein